MTLMFPRPPKPERGNKACRDYMGLVAQLACVCCRQPGVVVHHVIHGRFAQRRASDMDTIPLCPEHHRMLHDEPAAWKAAFGLDTDYIASTRRAVGQLQRALIGGWR